MAITKEIRVYQKKKLYREFGFRLQERERDSDPFVWQLKVNNGSVKDVVWNIKSQSGAYTLDGDLYFISGWDMLMDLMDLI